MAMLAGFLSVFVFGVTVAFLGSVKLQMAPRIGADDAQFGKIVAVFQWTMVVMAIVGGIALDNFGHRAIISAGALLCAIGIAAIARQRSVGGVMGACVVLAVGAQFVNQGGNTLLPGIFEDPSAGSNLGNAFFGLGALLVPIIAAALFRKTSYVGALTVVGALCVLPLLLALPGDFPSLPKSFSLGMAAGLMSSPVTWLAALTLFCYIGLEVSMAVWITSYASELGADEGGAAKTLSLFFVAMMVGRLFFGLQHHVTGLDPTPVGGFLLLVAALLAAAAIAGMMWAEQLSKARLFIVAAGFLFGPIFPTTIGVTFRHFPEEQWGTLFGVIFAVGLIGASTLPAWIGSLAKGKSVRSALRILLVTAVILGGIALALGLMPVAG